MPTTDSVLDRKGHRTMPRRSFRNWQLPCVLAVATALATLPAQAAFSQERLVPVTASPEVGIVATDDTDGGRCRVISKRRLFGGTFLHRKCDDRPALATVASQDVPQLGARAISDGDDALERGPTTPGDATPHGSPPSRSQTEVAPDDDTEGGRCRVISKRRLFGGTFMHRECDDTRRGART